MKDITRDTLAVTPRRSHARIVAGPAAEQMDFTVAPSRRADSLQVTEIARPKLQLVQSAATTVPHRRVRPIQPIVWTVAAFVLLVGAFLLDCASGNEVSPSLFYVIGIGVAAWLVGQRTALVLAFLSTMAWGIAVRIVGPDFTKPSVFYWNLGAELAVYVTIAVSLARIRRGLLHERQLVERLDLARGALDRETQAVGDLQREMLPPSLPAIRGYEWQVFYETSTRAGGDYYDFFTLPDGRIGVLLADASGHGAQATVLMAMMRAARDA